MGDGLGLPSLFRVDAGVCAGSVDESENRPAEFFCNFHDAERFAVAFRLGHAEIAIQLLLRISSLLVADEADRRVRHESETAHDRGIVTKVAVAVDFDELVADVLDVIEEVRTLRMTCKLYLLVRRKVFHRKHVRFAIKPLSAATGPTPAPAKSLLRKADRITPTNAFHGFHKFEVRRDLHIRIRPDQSRKPARKF